MYIIIVGCGRLGSNLAKGLADDGNDICIIDRNREKLDDLGSGFNGHKIKGIEFDSVNLMEAGVTKADVLLAVTPDDSINITVSLIAKKIFYVPKIIARVNEPGKKSIYSKLEIDTISPVEYEIEALKSKLLIDSIDVVAHLDNNVEIIEFLVNKGKVTSLEDIEKNYHCIISGLIKDGVVEIPDKKQYINNGERIICTIQKNHKEKLIKSFSKEILL